MIKQLSVIISTLNEEKYLPKLLSSISKQNFNGEMEVIVVDGRSEDKTIEKAKSFQSVIPQLSIYTTKKNLSSQRNFGEKKAKYETLLFLDADIVLPVNFLNKLQKNFHPKNKRFAASVYHWPLERHLFSYIIIALSYPALVECQYYSPWLPGSLILTSKTNHRAIDGFADGAVFGEDIDYAKRSVKSGAEYILLSRPFVYVSDRRAKKMGTLKLWWTWVNGYFYVVKYGPVYPGGIFPYEYGHYNTKNT